MLTANQKDLEYISATLQHSVINKLLLSELNWPGGRQLLGLLMEAKKSQSSRHPINREQQNWSTDTY